MSEKLNPNDFGLKLYNRFPPSYRLDDVDQRYALKRYLEAAAEGGFKYVIEEQNGILDLVNPQTSPLNVIYLLYEQYGLELFHGIPEEFLRAFLPNLGLAWAKKGSLDVVEYIVSSLSGIKTSTEVSYDEYDNPLVTVRLEMDFSVLNYFPDAKQFERILESFIPFYCDALLVYAYFYEDISYVHGDDTRNLTKITQYQGELGCIPFGIHQIARPLLNVEDIKLNENFVLNEIMNFGFDSGTLLNTDKLLNEDFVLNLPDTVFSEFDTDSHIDRVIYTLEDTGSIINTRGGTPLLNVPDKLLNEDIILNDGVIKTSDSMVRPMLNNPYQTLNNTFILNGRVDTEESLDIIRINPVKEQSDVRGSDLVRDKFSQAYSETGSIYSKGHGVSDDATLGSAVLGQAVLAVSEDYSDCCEDNIFMVTQENGGNLTNPVDTFLNTGYNELNSSFYLNPMSMLDRMMVVGSLNENFVLNGDMYNETTEVISVLSPTV